MKEHIVTCITCGKKFDANYGAHYIQKSRRYQCLSCYNAAHHPKKKEKIKNEKIPFIIKLVIGALFIIGAIQLKSAVEIIISIAIGFALIAWALIPYFKKKNLENTKEE